MVKTIDLNFLEKPKSIAAFAVADEAGYTLVECGPYSTHDTLLRGLAEHDIEPQQVHTLLLSHIHFDHAGAAWWWARQGTQVYVHPRGHKHMLDPTRLYNSARQIYGSRMEELWGKMEAIAPERLTAVDDRQVVERGGRRWTAHHTPGHASHHIAWQLDDAVFTGDVGGCRINGGPVVPPCPPPDIDSEAWHESIARLRSLDAARFYLTHYGEITDVNDHLNELGDRLDSYLQWMEPYYRDGARAETVEPLFKQFYSGELREAGVSEADLESYLAANPPYMSVTGLLRWLRIRDERAAADA
ncbi:glyoxylase-like metal-dependent hydrolase (beta-lactamase superfamily II) [Lewinella marina]|uniref:MBL fold hydrolase n=1 Tax=Neolewinella marina TaxID=438751 RepID=A0A2G0CFX9_9BACT|nr:MBL fold metallo-hydrolase [Neolewinella marina]NJB85440.1 glyoxylase-like metal-dependent hydrolase (beta-lactamase superfamily II) [Neolewinella marina]PHK98868.1 MBL fold hydrolase [Neolewinella marina]